MDGRQCLPDLQRYRKGAVVSEGKSKVSVQTVGDKVQVAKNTMTIAVFNALGMVGALGVDILLAARFGLSSEMDALFVALTVPQLVYVIVSNSCSAVLVPSFSRLRVERRADEVWKLFSALVSIALLLFTALAALGAAASQYIVVSTAPGLDGDSLALAIRLNRRLFWLLVPAGAVQTMGAVLNAHQRFAVPAALNLVRYGVVIAFAWAGAPSRGLGAVAAGYVAASVAQMVVLAFAVWRVGGRYRPALDLHDPELRNVGRLLGPSLLKGAVGQSGVVFERLLASFLPPGSISAVGYARRILRAVSSVLLSSVSTVLLPRFSVLAAGDRTPSLKRAVAFGVRLTSFLAVPVVILLVTLNVPIIHLAFQRGAFDAQATQITAGIMALYVLSVPPIAISQVIGDVLPAMGDTLTPLCIRIITLLTNVALDVALVQVLGPYGLALSLLLARGIGLGTEFVVVRRRLGAFGLGLKEHWVRLALASAPLAGVSLCARWLWEHQQPLSWSYQLLTLIVASSLGLLAYGGVMLKMGVRGLDEAVAVLRRRWADRGTARDGPSGTPSDEAPNPEYGAEGMT
ncbi:MAG TPA: lipid II flippase MurJ [Anaerolineae bacterium]|nr:lipid II flippase MurJ [Anaerolineae bacterium]